MLVRSRVFGATPFFVVSLEFCILAVLQGVTNITNTTIHTKTAGMFNYVVISYDQFGMFLLYLDSLNGRKVDE